MIRRRIVRLEDTVTDEQGAQKYVLYCPRNEREYSVDVSQPEVSRIEEIQNELAVLLHADRESG